MCYRPVTRREPPRDYSRTWRKRRHEAGRGCVPIEKQRPVRIGWSLLPVRREKGKTSRLNPKDFRMLDRIFKAYDVRATYPNPLNEEVAWKVGHATGQYLQRSRVSIPAGQKVKRKDTLVVGRDMRPHSPALAAARSMASPPPA